MESKTKYRILGILVVIAIVIIVMPFVHFKKDASSEAPVIVPPFPGDSAQLSTESFAAANPEPMRQQAADTINDMSNEAEVARPLAVTDSSAEVKSNVPSLIPVTEDTTQQARQNAIPDIQPAVAPLSPAPVKAAQHATKKQPTITHQPRKKVAATKDLKHVAIVSKKVIAKAKQPAAIKPKNFVMSNLSVQDNGLYDLKKPIWVIQLGSFQDKSEAIRMVNSLRANGYKAFFQELETALGEKTRVFVGPEVEQAAARHLARQIEAELKLHGVVANYKPFTL